MSHASHGLQPSMLVKEHASLVAPALCHQKPHGQGFAMSARLCVAAGLWMAASYDIEHDTCLLLLLACLLLCMPLICWMTGGRWSSLAACVPTLVLLYLYLSAVAYPEREDLLACAFGFLVLSASLACFIQSADTLLSSGMFGIRYWSTRMWAMCIFGCVGAGLQLVMWTHISSRSNTHVMYILRNY